MSILLNELTRRETVWYTVQCRLKVKPEEASIVDKTGVRPLYRALQRPIRNYPPNEIVKMLLEAYPPAMWEKSEYCPLLVACWRRAPLEVLNLLTASRPSRAGDEQSLIALYKSYVTVLGNDEEHLVRFVKEGGREGAEIWTKLYTMLRYCTVRRMENWFAVHAAVSQPSCSMSSFLLSHVLFPDQVRQRNRKGNLPLHLYANTEAHQFLEMQKLEALQGWFPQAATVRNGDGRLPIHVAIDCGRSWPFMSELLSGSPDTISAVDGPTQLFPFQQAACSGDGGLSLTIIYELLRRAPQLIQDTVRTDEFNDETDATAQVLACPTEEELVDTVEEALSDCLYSWKLKTFEPTKTLLSFGSGDSGDWTLVHAAASIRECPEGLLQLAISFSAKDLQSPNDRGDLPLHIVASHSLLFHFQEFDEDEDWRGRQTKLLVEAYPDGASVRNKAGMLPLALAIDSGQPWQALDALIHAAPETLCKRDSKGLYPFQQAATGSKTDLTKVFRLLRSAPNLILAET